MPQKQDTLAPDAAPLTTRMRLIVTSARLFHLKGYHGAGLIEILAQAKAPKGSMYHHFPNGKPDLALAAADWAGAGVLQAITDAFDGAEDYTAGISALCESLADSFDTGGRAGCPVTPLLLDDPANTGFTDRAAEILGKWIRAIGYHGILLGEDEDIAEDRAESFVIALEGAWTLARARQSAAPLRQLAERYRF